MTQQISPFIDAKFGWGYGESGWNGGMDENQLKFSFLFDGNVDGVVTSLPAAVNGNSYFLTTDNRFYFVVGTTYYTSPCPKHFIFKVKSTGAFYQYNGTTAVLIDNPTQLDSRLDAVELTASSLGTAAFEDVGYFATQGNLDVVSSQANTYTDTLRSDLANSASTLLGASLVGYKSRTLRQKFADEFSVKDFGAVGNGVANDYQAFVDAVAAAQAVGGGRVVIPSGVYKINSTLLLSPMGSGWHNVSLEGSGSGSTVLDFSGAVAGSDGIGVVGWGGRVELSDFTVKSAPAVGINWNKDSVRGDASWVSRISMRNIIVDSCGSDGVKFVQVYMGGFENVESRNNGTYGFNLQGSHTSMVFDRCWAGGDAVYPNGGNLGSGWFINGIIYSTFNGCSSDQNAGAGYIVQNTAGVVFSGCGSESNGEEGWLLKSSNTGTSGIPAITENIKGLHFDGCFAVDNSKASVNTYANLIGAITADSRPIEFSVSNCVDYDTVGITTSITLTGTSGDIALTENSNKLFGVVTRTGSTSVQNNSVVGRSALAQLSANQSIPDATDTSATFATITTNRLGATLSGNVVVIPEGVNRVKVSAGALWDTNSTNDRTISIVKNGASAPGLPQSKVKGSGTTGQVVTSSIIEVVTGDSIGLLVNQNSGGALNLLADDKTYLSVEAIG